jgi:S1-C subfamily serine protease
MIKSTARIPALVIVVPIVAASVGLGTATNRVERSPKQAMPAVAADVVGRAKASVTQVLCVHPGAGRTRVGTGFRMSYGTVASAHVVAACTVAMVGSETIRYVPVAVVARDPIHDVALMSGGLSVPALQAETSSCHVGEHVVLLGDPGESFPAKSPAALRGVIAQMSSSVTMADDSSKITLGDAIIVTLAESKVLPGDSGGPAIDAAGNVVGIIEGGGGTSAILTPVADVRCVTVSGCY